MKLIFKFNLDLINELPKKLQERYLVYFSGNEDWRVRSNVASHPNTPVNVLVKLAEDEYWLVRYNVARNTNTPVRVLEKLSEDSNGDVRYIANHFLWKKK